MKILMCPPLNYKVQYNINEFMTDSDGRLNVVDSTLATKQWNNLKQCFIGLGLDVLEIMPQAKLADMVFTANNALYIDNKIFLGQMKSPYRQPEINLFLEWYENHNYNVIQSPKNVTFEGTGDALWVNDRRLLLCGYGQRTSIKAYEWIQGQIEDVKLIKLSTERSKLYHLDTAIAVLSASQLAVVTSVFSKKEIKLLESDFEIVDVDYQEALNNFAANLYCPDGKNVIIQKGNVNLVSKLKLRGYHIHEVDTSEFIKSGGSVFCLKLQLF